MQPVRELLKRLGAWEPSPRFERIAWGVLLAFQFFSPIALSRWNYDIPDEDLYKDLARNLANKGQYFLDVPSFHHHAGDPNTYFAPGWPACMSVGYRLFGAPGFWIVLGLVWCLASLATDRLARALHLPGRMRWLLLAWLATNPILFVYHEHAMTEPLAIALGAATLAAGISWLERPAWKTAALFGAVAALGHLTRTALVLPAIGTLLVGARFIPWRRYVPMAAVFAVAHLVVLGPWLLRMRSVGAGMTATELKLGINLYIYNNPYVENPYKIRPDESFREPADLDDLPPAARNAELVHLGIEGIRRDPLHYLHTCLRRVGYLFAPWPSFATMSWVNTAGVAMTTLLYLYAFWGLFLRAAVWDRSSLSKGAWAVLAALGCWYAFHVFFHASMRQRLPSDVWVPALALAAWSRRRASGRTGADGRDRESLSLGAPSEASSLEPSVAARTSDAWRAR